MLRPLRRPVFVRPRRCDGLYTGVKLDSLFSGGGHPKTKSDGGEEKTVVVVPHGPSETDTPAETARTTRNTIATQ